MLRFRRFRLKKKEKKEKKTYSFRQFHTINESGTTVEACNENINLLANAKTRNAEDPFVGEESGALIKRGHQTDSIISVSRFA